MALFLQNYRFCPYLYVLRKSGDNDVSESKEREVFFILPIISSLMVILLIITITPDAQAYSYSNSHWSSKSQVVTLLGTVKGNYLAAAKQAVSNINSATKVSFSAGSRLSWQATSQNYGKTGWEGESSYTFLVSGYTKTAISKVNTYYIGSSSPVARRRVLWLHEFSHVWGLGHSSPNTVMNSSASAAYSRGVRYLTADDIQGINSRY